jgi:Lrp/AsnC family transcriptional regulator, regulator for asnA, asnC and gidA
MMKIDETNIEIIKHLRDGRKSFSAIADALLITENTVRSRVNKLVEEGILEISGLVDPESLPGHRMIVIGVKLSTVELVRMGEEFTKLRGVVSVSVVTGRYDLIAQVMLNEKEGFGLLEFFTEELSKIEELREVETFVVYQAYNLRVPYIL